ncbi:MAG TPA: DUF1232 domain-containing protein [Phototrophicaceae bacterium]|nr:DUF1232 domain-containing protein [Phototrophicaceae bacterium]
MNIFRTVLNQFRLTWRLLRDARVPLWAKIIPFVGLAYVLSPLDLIPDVLIGLGQLDDLGIILGGMRLFEAVVPEYLVAEHRLAITRSQGPLEVVDAPRYRVSRQSEKSQHE